MKSKRAAVVYWATLQRMVNDSGFEWKAEQTLFGCSMEEKLEMIRHKRAEVEVVLVAKALYQNRKSILCMYSRGPVITKAGPLANEESC